MTMDADPLQARGSDVAMLSNALRRGGSALESVPEQIKQILVDETWRHFVTKLGKEVHHERFADFVTTPPLAGLGATDELVERVIADDPEAVRLYRKAKKGTHNVSTKSKTTHHGNRRDYALERLHRDAPELHAEVVAGNLKANAAMIRAGFRHPTATVRTDSPEHVAAALRRLLSPEDVELVAKLLTGDN